ncbi:MAG: FAD-dependent monooxygenase [Actinobacteria bacterium]|nr:FAD-dependent monooxygenase [Actinomycetota bacterium]
MRSHTTDSMQLEVAIVGAGPVGLLLAGDLAAAGTRTVVWESSPAPSAMPKANGIVGHAAVELEQRGLLSGTGLAVLSPSRFAFGPLSLDLGSDANNPLHILPIPQRRLEELLEARAVAHGARIYRGHTPPRPDHPGR